MGIAEFRALLRERAGADEAERAAVDRKAWERWGRECAVMVTDMASFSRLTREHGILHFLSMIERMQTLSQAVIEEHGGRLIKAVADNLFATFETPQAAVDAALELARAFRLDGRGRDDDERVRLAVGIAYGRILDLDGEDMFGDAVNIASKLGEDTAGGGDIYITADAAKMVEIAAAYRFDPRSTRVSELDLDYVALIRR